MNKLKLFVENHFVHSLITAVVSYLLTLSLGGGWVWLSFVMFVAVGVLLCTSLESLWDKLFSGICLICLCYIAFPKLLESEWFYVLIDRIFSGLRYSVYKSTFAESFGALLGSVVAIIGALWTQHYFTRISDKKREIEDMRVVYYDMIYSSMEIYNILMHVAESDNAAVPPLPNIYSRPYRHTNLVKINHDKGVDPYYITVFRRDIHAYQVLITDDWIRLVANLPDTFSNEERCHIYYMYGQLSHINQAINAYCTASDDLRYEYLFAVYERMYNFLVITHDLEGARLLNTTSTVCAARQYHESIINTLENKLKETSK